MTNSKYRNYVIYVLIGIAILAVLVGVRNNTPPLPELTVGELAAKIKSGEPIDSIQVNQDAATIIFGDSPAAVVHLAPGHSLEELLTAYDVTPAQLSHLAIEYSASSGLTPLVQTLLAILPLLLIAGFIYLVLRSSAPVNKPVHFPADSVQALEVRIQALEDKVARLETNKS